MIPPWLQQVADALLEALVRARVPWQVALNIVVGVVAGLAVANQALLAAKEGAQQR